MLTLCLFVSFVFASFFAVDSVNSVNSLIYILQFSSGGFPNSLPRVHWSCDHHDFIILRLNVYPGSVGGQRRYFRGGTCALVGGWVCIRVDVYTCGCEYLSMHSATNGFLGSFGLIISRETRIELRSQGILKNGDRFF